MDLHHRAQTARAPPKVQAHGPYSLVHLPHSTARHFIDDPPAACPLLEAWSTMCVAAPGLAAPCTVETAASAADVVAVVARCALTASLTLSSALAPWAAGDHTFGTTGLATANTSSATTPVPPQLGS